MAVTDIASLATSMAQTQLRQDVGVAVLKKALDLEASSALALIQALPATLSASSLPVHIGQSINTIA